MRYIKQKIVDDVKFCVREDGERCPFYSSLYRKCKVYRDKKDKPVLLRSKKGRPIRCKQCLLDEVEE